MVDSQNIGDPVSQLDDMPVFSRLDNRDLRVQVLLSPDEFTWSKEEAERRDISHSAYFRSLMVKDRSSVEMSKLSHGERRKNTPDPAQLLRNLAQMLSEYK